MLVQCYCSPIWSPVCPLHPSYAVLFQWICHVDFSHSKFLISCHVLWCLGCSKKFTQFWNSEWNFITFYGKKSFSCFFFLPSLSPFFSPVQDSSVGLDHLHILASSSIFWLFTSPGLVFFHNILIPALKVEEYVPPEHGYLPWSPCTITT